MGPYLHIEEFDRHSRSIQTNGTNALVLGTTTMTYVQTSNLFGTQIICVWCGPTEHRLPPFLPASEFPLTVISMQTKAKAEKQQQGEKGSGRQFRKCFSVTSFPVQQVRDVEGKSGKSL
jgi:hypothetical protein